jgi:hypothetical protein
MKISEKIQKDNHVKMFGNRHCTITSPLFNEKQLLWIEHAIEKRVLKLSPFFFCRSFQCGDTKSEIGLRKSFYEKSSEDTTIMNMHPVCTRSGKHPRAGKMQI